MTSRRSELDDIREDLEIFVEKTAAHIGDSSICVSIFTDDYKKGLDSLLQFAIALMLDKPIYLLVREGTFVPDKIRRIADGIEFYRDELDALDACRRLLEKAQRHGAIPR